MQGRNGSARGQSRNASGGKKGQAATEFALAYIAILVPVTFAMIYTALLLWTWHSISDFTREGARYAVSHCWQNGAGNVLTWMRQNVPLTWDREQFVSGPAEIQVLYYARNPESGELTEFTCDGDCSTACVPDVVKVAVANYEFRGFVAYLGLPPVRMPDFQTSLAVESAGCDAETAACQP
ncbi:MAG: TadE family protein [Bryobacteraceae bacterium]|nr:TadE family protein [Bryobacteraceae bacterium]